MEGEGRKGGRGGMERSKEERTRIEEREEGRRGGGEEGRRGGPKRRVERGEM